MNDFEKNERFSWIVVLFHVFLDGSPHCWQQVDTTIRGIAHTSKPLHFSIDCRTCELVYFPSKKNVLAWSRFDEFVNVDCW